MRIRRNTTGLRGALVAAAFAGLAVAGCDDPTAPETKLGPTTPDFHVDDEQPVRMTGGGRIDSPPGGTEKNTPESRVFQTFGFNIASDRDGDGLPDGNLQFVDHTPENRLNGRPVNLHSVSWSTFRRTVDACADAGVEATGSLEVRNTGEHHSFRMWACDSGEPGVGRDIFELEVFYDSGELRWRWKGILTGGNLQAHFDKNGGGAEPTTGALDVSTSTSGSDIDPDGYTVVVDETQSQAIGVNGTVRFADLAAGDHVVELTGVAANCTVSGSNPRTVSVTAGEVASTTYSVSCEAMGDPVTTRIEGIGSIGTGAAAPGEPRQDFDFKATDAPGGHLRYTDWGVVRPDGTVGRVTVDPTLDPSTAITSFVRSAEDPACVTFGGVGRVDTGETAEFTVTACDYATPGLDRDFFEFAIPARSYVRRDRLSAGDIILSTS